MNYSIPAKGQLLLTAIQSAEQERKDSISNLELQKQQLDRLQLAENRTSEEISEKNKELLAKDKVLKDKLHEKDTKLLVKNKLLKEQEISLTQSRQLKGAREEKCK